LNEAFACWAATWAAAAVAPEIDAGLLFSVRQKQAAYDADQRITSHPVCAEVARPADAFSSFDEISYHKGASVLRQLVGSIGEDAFLRGLRRYLHRWSWSNARLADLVGEMSEAAGRDLTRWARDWLQTSGVDTLRLVTTTADGVYTGAWIEQSTAGARPVPREHTLGIAVLDSRRGSEGLHQRGRFTVTATGPRTPVTELVGQPVASAVLLNDGDLAYAKIRLDDRSLAAVVHPGQMPYAHQRTLCLAIARDMVRDGELGAEQFVDMVVAVASSEERPAMLVAWMHHAVAVAGRYAPEDCLSLLAGPASVYRRIAGEPAADRSMRLAALEALTATASSPDQLDDLDRWLVRREGGAVEAEGLRWRALARLAALGRLTREQVDGEGGVQAVLAALPDPDAKRAAWDAVFRPGVLPALEVVDVAATFWQPHQGAVLAGYAERYLDELPRLEGQHGWMGARVRAVRMFPATGWTPHLFRRAEDLADSTDLTPLLRGLLAAQLDELRRVASAQHVERCRSAGP
jgi:aminopeptidase N